MYIFNYRSVSDVPECSVSGLKKDSVLCFTKYLGKHLHFEAYSFFGIYSGNSLTGFAFYCRLQQ
jgi:hypothetical protein